MYWVKKILVHKIDVGGGSTPLPSSAAVERMFCIGGDILRDKRSRLAGRRFEELVFLKGNLKLLGYDSL